MSTDSKTITPETYFKPNGSIGISEENIKKFRECYRKYSNVTHFTEDNINKESIINAARELGIQINPNDHQQILEESVKYKDEEKTFRCVEKLLPKATFVSNSSLQQPKKDKQLISLKEIKCKIIIKYADERVINFIRPFLLPNVDESNNTA